MSNFFKQRLTKTLSEQSGIALIEILVVVGIVVALAAIVLPFYS
jgi:type II secretory pathway pseudopilin PulG